MRNIKENAKPQKDDDSNVDEINERTFNQLDNSIQQVEASLCSSTDSVSNNSTISEFDYFTDDDEISSGNSDTKREDDDDDMNLIDVNNSNISDRAVSSDTDEELEVGSALLKISINDELIHDDSDKTVNKIVLHCLNLFVKEKISKSALAGVLSITHEILPEHNRMPKTIFKLFKHLRDQADIPVVTKHYFCKICHQSDYIDKMQRNCSYCDGNKEISFFYELDIVNQIKNMFGTRNLASILKTSNNRDKNIITDITDGTEYRRINSREGRGKFDLTLIFNTDGLSLVKSAKSQCWPLMYSIAEIPAHHRDTFISIIGLRYDKEMKPPMNMFLQPFCEKLKKCFESGIEWTHPETGEIIISKVAVPLFVADAPARAQLQNITNFNGKYGCNICEIRTKPAERILRKRTPRIFSYSEATKLRNDFRMKQQAKRVIFPKKRRTIRGVKGPSILSYLFYLDLSTCLVPEFLHSVLLGVIKQFIKIFLLKKGPWSINEFINEINNFLLNIKPPDSFGRMPLLITEYNNYKAYEFLFFLLFYSLPIFSEYGMKSQYLQHWILLVKGIHNLLQSRISMADIEEADKVLKMFVKQIKDLYTDRELSYNVHQLLHLALIVLRWGPLWAASAFPYENVNGILARFVHGKNNIGEELVKNINIAHGVQVLKSKTDRENNSGKSQLSMSFVFLNEIKNFKLNSTERQLLSSNNFMQDKDKITFHSRVSYNRIVYTSKKYKETKTNNYTVQLNLKNDDTIYGMIRFHIQHKNEWYFVLQCFKIVNDNFFVHEALGSRVEHIIPIEEASELMLVKSSMIQDMSLVIRVGEYICKIPRFIKKNL